jgi:hypothetical protein
VGLLGGGQDVDSWGIVRYDSEPGHAWSLKRGLHSRRSWQHFGSPPTRT